MRLPGNPPRSFGDVKAAFDHITGLWSKLVKSQTVELRMVRGGATTAGAKDFGEDFTVSKTATGKYTIVFNPVFTGKPAVSFGGQAGFLADKDTGKTHDATTIGVIVTDPATATPTDQNFMFIAVGPA